MPLKAPELDRRDFEALYREALLRIPRYTPEWTDLNESDPGIALLQLAAWLTDMMFYEMNQVPERNYIKFLQLLNMELRPAQPATAYLTFTPREGAQVGPVLQGTQVGAQPPEGGEPLIFETEIGLSPVRLPLTDVQVFDGTTFNEVKSANAAHGSAFRPFGWLPQVGSALYLGFSQTDPPIPETDPLFPQDLRVRVFLPVETLLGVPQNCREALDPPTPPVRLVWEYIPAGSKHWRRLNVSDDRSSAFTREGDIVLEGPDEVQPTEQGKVKEKRFWLRCRIAGGSYPSGRAPVIDFVRINTVQAVNLSTVREEIIGISEGIPDQSFRLRYTPVHEKKKREQSLVLQTEVEDQEPVTWQRVDDFFASQPDDEHYILNVNTGEIQFGDGRKGRIPVAGATIVAKVYRYGGGEAGNLGPGLINTLLSPVAGIDSVTNERAAVGGRDEQKVNELREEAPHRLRSRNRAVTEQDFAALAREAGGIKRATAAALAHPAHPGVEVPGAVTVVVVPDNEDMPPRPTSDEIQAVCRYLEQFRVLTTELFVQGPDYQAITVEARVTANPYAAFDAVAQAVKAAINKELDPMKWRFGQELHPTSLYGVMLAVDDVVSVPLLEIRVNGRPHDTLNDPIIVPKTGLVYGADDHEIAVVPEEDL